MSSFGVEPDFASPSMSRAPRGRAVRAILAATAVAGTVVATMPAPGRPVSAGSIPQVMRAPYLTDLTLDPNTLASSARVNLATDTPGSTAPVVVSFGTTFPGCSDKGTVNATQGAAYSNVGVAGTEYRWTALLSGLTADTDYCYGVTQGGVDLIGQINTAYQAFLPVGGFKRTFHTTPPSSVGSFTFAVVGDFGFGSQQENQILYRMGLINPRFVVTVGDNVYNSGSESEYGDLSPAPNASVLPPVAGGTGNLFAPQYWPQLGGGVPAFFAQGNHGFSGSAPLFADIPQGNAVSSSGGKYGPEDYPVTSAAPFSDCGSHQPPNPGDPCLTTAGTYGSDYYAFTYGNSRFYVLHSAWTDHDTAATCMPLPPGQTDPSGGPYCADYINHWRPNSPEYLWLQNDLATHASQLKFAFFHYPLWAGSGAQGSNPYTNSAGPAASASLESLLANNGVDIVFNGHDHTYLYNGANDLPNSPMVSYVTGGGGDPGTAPGNFLAVTVNGNTVRVDSTDDTGKVFDTHNHGFGAHGTLSGTVTGPGSVVGIAGAAITCSCGGTTLTTVTDGAGKYTLSSPVGTATVTAKAVGYNDGTSAPVSVGDGQLVSANFQLGSAQSSNSVTGQVTDSSTTRPIAGAAVTLDAGSPATTTDMNGRFVLIGTPSGAHSVRTAPANYSSKTMSVTTGTAPVDVNLAVIPAGSILGTVTDNSTLKAVVGATVTATSSGLPTMTTTTNSGGSYSFVGVPKATWQVSATANAYIASSPTPVTVTPGSQMKANFTLVPAPTTGYVTGTVTDAPTGNIIDGASVTCSCGPTATSGTDGSYYMPIPQGSVTLTVSDGSYASQSVSVTIAAGHTTTQSFALSLPSSQPPPPGGGGGVQGSHISGTGYWLVASDGGIFPFGSAGGYGSTGGMHLNQPIVGMARTPNAGGYWLVATDGGIFPFGNAGGYGSTGGIHLNSPIVAMAPTSSGHGYWLVASDGGIFPFGDAGGYGSAGGMHLNSPIVGMAPTPSGHGYWLVATDGGIFPFGDAGGYGSTGGIHLNQPIVAMAPTASGHGYWLVASDGGIFPFGDAGGYGSTGGTHLNQPIVGMTSTPDGGGYWLVATDGGIFPFGNAGGFGSTGGIHLNRPIVGMAVS